jgi:hypothetical protein
MWPLILAMAGGGLLKSELVDQPREDRSRKLAADTQRYSPWTGLQAGAIKEADPLGSAINFGLTGAALGQGMQSAQTDEALKKSMIEKNNAIAGTGPATSSSVAAPYKRAAALDNSDEAMMLNQNSSKLPVWYQMTGRYAK